tara:strand:+ start:406 stop:1053 length:648 start_codon:yes stop_codon:yes gene_type:complete
MSDDKDKVENGNKNIWLAISLAIITSLTSVVTAVINKDEESSESATQSENITTEFKVFQEKYKNDIERIEGKIKKNGKNLDLHKIVVSQTRNTNKKKFENLEKIDESLIVIAKDLEKKHNILKKGVYNYINDRIRESSSKSISRDINIQKEIDKNTNRSIICYASLSEDDIKKGKSILSIINGEGMNKSLNQQKLTNNLIKHLNIELLKKTNSKK